MVSIYGLGVAFREVIDTGPCRLPGALKGPLILSTRRSVIGYVCSGSGQGERDPRLRRVALKSGGNKHGGWGTEGSAV